MKFIIPFHIYTNLNLIKIIKDPFVFVLKFSKIIDCHFLCNLFEGGKKRFISSVKINCIVLHCYYWSKNKLSKVQSSEDTYFTWEQYFTRCVDRADSFRASFQSGTINRGIEQLRVYTATKYTLLNPLIVFEEVKPVYSDLRIRNTIGNFIFRY